jgi:hypothetical protein
VSGGETAYAIYSGAAALFGVCVLLCLAVVGFMRILKACTSRTGRFIEMRKTIFKHTDSSVVDDCEEDLFEFLEEGFNSPEIRYMVHRIKKNPITREER